MKNILIVLLLGALVLSSCSESFLELDPVSELNAGNFFRNESDFERATIGIYDAYSGAIVPLLVMKNTRSDDAFHQLENTFSSSIFIDQFEMLSDDPTVKGFWDAAYFTIQQANIVLTRIEGIDLSEDTKNKFMGEALFMRSLAYYELTLALGDVPFPLSEITSPNESFQFERESKDLILDQIKNDLTTAIDLLPSKGGIAAGRATNDAARTLLGKVHLTLNEFSEAENVLSQITSATLLPSYESVFAGDNENNEESIFEYQFLVEQDPGGLLAALLPRARSLELFGNDVADGGGQALPTTSLLDSYEEGDLRRYQAFDTLTFSDGEFLTWSAKGTNGPALGFGSGDNRIIFRYADVLLMRAEALSQRGTVNSTEAIELVNQVRRRAYGLDINTPAPSVDISNLDANSLLLERRRELALEDQRWPDLIRFGEAINAMALEGYTISEDKLLFPIPQVEIDTNPRLTQNSGY